MNTLYPRIAVAIVVLGAINWGLIGLFDWNAVAAIFGGATHTPMSGLTRLVYTVFGLAALVAVAYLLGTARSIERGGGKVEAHA